jgi:hypothetical protein
MERWELRITESHYVGETHCVGIASAERTRRAARKWLDGVDPGPMETGTPEHYEAYVEASDEAWAHHRETLERSEDDLVPALRGKEGKWVIVVDGDTGLSRAVLVGRSSGWLPVHLECGGDGSDGIPIDVRPGSVIVPIAGDGRRYVGRLMAVRKRVEKAMGRASDE